MTCEQCAALAPALIDGAISTAERARLLAHLQTCAACRLRLHHDLNACGHLSCREVVALVSAYLEERLSPAERDRFERHLAMCPPCGVYVEQLRETVQALGTLREETLSDEVKVPLLVAFRALIQQDRGAPTSGDQPSARDEGHGPFLAPAPH
jgi:anti-sigma factor RsiW